MKKKFPVIQQSPRRILGIDPGLGSTGVGIIEESASGWVYVESRVVLTNASQEMPKRLLAIYELVQQAIKTYAPTCAVVEGIFFAKNVKSSVQMAHGRGVALLAAAETSIPVYELSPLEIKQSVVGKGRATKEQVSKMVMLLLQLADAPKTDHESDALACAIAWAFREKYSQLINVQSTDNKQDTNKSLLSLRRSSKSRSRGWKS